MRVLGLETATRKASVGLVVDGEIAAERTHPTDGNHAVTLLPLIDELLRSVSCAVDALDAVAVSGGPGSFTGLRVGLSVAKGLAHATGIRLVTVPTLEALARTVVDREGVIWSLLDARKGEIYAASFESSGGGCVRLTADALLIPESLCESLPAPSVIIGDAVGPYATLLRRRLGNNVAILPFETHGPRGAVVALMGTERLSASDTTDVASAEPFYTQLCEAERKTL